MPKAWERKFIIGRTRAISLFVSPAERRAIRRGRAAHACGDYVTLQAMNEKRLAAGLADIATGRVLGPFSSAKTAIRSLHREARRLKKR